MNKSKVFSYCLLVGSIFYYCAEQCLAQDAPAWKERLLTEAPGKWEEYRVRGKHLQGSCLTTARQYQRSVNLLYRIRYEFKQNDTGASFLKQPLEGANMKDTVGELLVQNPRYGFQLKRSKPDKSWTIAGLNLNLNEGFKLGAFPPDLSVREMVDRPFIFASSYQCFPDLMKDPNYVVKRVTPDHREGVEWVRVEFTYHPHMVPQHKYKQSEIAEYWNDLSGGWVLLDPAHYWVIRESSTIHEWWDHTKSVLDSRSEYKIQPDGFPILLRITGRYKDIGGQGATNGQEVTDEFDLTERGDVPDSDFTLSAYGFPEPTGLPSRSPLFVWIATSGIACLGGAILYRWWFQRRKRAAAGAI